VDVSQQRVEIVEVSPRDGLQADPADLNADQKIELITRLVEAGHTRIEATSFVNPKAVPKMANAAEVMAGVPRRPGVRYSALVFNPMGVQRAVSAKVDEINGVIVATETFSQRNQNASVAESIDRWRTVVSEAEGSGLRTSVTISAAFGCAYEGEVAPDAVLSIVKRLADIGMDELCIADTIGVAVPNRVAALFAAVQAVVDVPLRGHFHNTRNTAVANIAACLDAGVFTFDTSLGGVGGCPFSPRATGNVATEDVVFMVERMGYTTGLSLPALIETTEWFETVLHHSTPSLVTKAGGFPTRPD
jgi:hydroxymethylglutaryl-CoA lyase